MHGLGVAPRVPEPSKESRSNRKVIHESGNGFQMLVTWFWERESEPERERAGRASVFTNPSLLQSKV